MMGGLGWLPLGLGLAVAGQPRLKALEGRFIPGLAVTLKPASGAAGGCLVGPADRRVMRRCHGAYRIHGAAYTECGIHGAAYTERDTFAHTVVSLRMQDARAAALYSMYAA